MSDWQTAWKAQKCVYVAIDVEASGKIPGRNSMLSLGAAAFTEEGGAEPISTFTVNLEELPDAVFDADTKQWWESVPEIWAAARQDAVPPRQAMEEFARWVAELPGYPVCVGCPASFDYLFVYWYLIFFLDKSPFGFSAVDMMSFAMGHFGWHFVEVDQREMPKEWFAAPHTHVALEDAVFQGKWFIRMFLARRGERPA